MMLWVMLSTEDTNLTRNTHVSVTRDTARAADNGPRLCTDATLIVSYVVRVGRVPCFRNNRAIVLLLVQCLPCRYGCTAWNDESVWIDCSTVNIMLTWFASHLCFIRTRRLQCRHSGLPLWRIMLLENASIFGVRSWSHTNCYGKSWRLLCPFFRNLPRGNLHLRENLAPDCFTPTASTVTNSVQNIFTRLRYCDK